MLKLGVWRGDQFLPSAPQGVWNYIRYRLSRSRVSLRLLDISGQGRSAEEQFERLMPHVRLANGVYRTTFRERFRDFDPWVNQVLAAQFPAPKELRVEDWAASACLTSAEWAESLQPLFPRLQFTASDLLLFLVDVEELDSGRAFVAEPGGKPLQFVDPPFVIRMEPPEPWGLPLNRLLYRRALQRWKAASQMWPLPESWLADPFSNQVLTRAGYRIRKLSLIHPRALALAASAPDQFSAREHSIFEPAPVPCHVIRSMNILNLAYFPSEQLAQGVRSVASSLIDGGMWIVGRTVQDQPPVHHATMYRKTGARTLEPLARFGDGSEIEPIVREHFSQEQLSKA